MLRLSGKGKINVKKSYIYIYKQPKEFGYLHQYIEKELHEFINKSSYQLEASLSIQNYLITGELMPKLGKWAVSIDFALYLINLIESKKYNIVIEFGSGTSTLLIAKALKKIYKNKGDSYQQITFEHLEKFFQETLENLKRKSLLDNAVKLMLSPLRTYNISKNEAYLYYSECSEVLEKLAKNIQLSQLKVLVVIDGPPSTTGRHARYPALPIVMKYFSGAEVDFLLDDYIRQDEQEVVNMWKKFLEKSDVEFQSEELDFEKRACLIHIPGKNS